MQPLSRRAALFLLLVSLACPLFAATKAEAMKVTPSTQPSTALPADLNRVLRDYERAWRAKDPAALAALFTEDGFVLASGRPAVRGRAAIREAYANAGGPLFLRAFAY